MTQSVRTVRQDVAVSSRLQLASPTIGIIFLVDMDHGSWGSYACLRCHDVAKANDLCGSSMCNSTYHVSSCADHA
jgi:hypothetical protein